MPRRRRLGLEALEGREVPATFVVNSLLDTPDAVIDGTAADQNGNATLRAAIMEANAAAGSHVIEIQNLTGTINLGSALPVLDRDVFINNTSGSSGLTVQRQGSDEFRIFTVNANKVVVLGGLTLRNGLKLGENDEGLGGAVFNKGHLTVSGCVVTANGAVAGGGIANDNGATLYVYGSAVSSNLTIGGGGGGIFNKGYAEVSSGSVVTGNVAYLSGGGIRNGDAGATLIVRNSTVSNNDAQTEGGGGIDSGGTLTLENSTVTGNRALAAGKKGGGVYAGGTITITGCTFGNNQAASGTGIYWVVNSTYTANNNTMNSDTVVSGPA